MTRASHDPTHDALKDTVGQKEPAATPRKPQEESLKRHGDELQSLVDKATGGDSGPH